MNTCRRERPRLSIEMQARERDDDAAPRRGRSSQVPWPRMIHSTLVPHRSPGAPGDRKKQVLSGRPIRYYRPRGSADVRALIDDGFQAFNAARLSEACHIYADKMLAPEHDTTIGLTLAGALTPAGLGGCLIELMERGLIDFMISTGANLYHDLHYALNFTLRRGSPFLDDRRPVRRGRHPHLRRAVPGVGADRDRRSTCATSSRAPASTARSPPPSCTSVSARICCRARPAARSTPWSPLPRNTACRSTPRRRATAPSA